MDKFIEEHIISEIQKFKKIFFLDSVFILLPFKYIEETSNIFSISEKIIRNFLNNEIYIKYKLKTVESSLEDIIKFIQENDIKDTIFGLNLLESVRNIKSSVVALQNYELAGKSRDIEKQIIEILIK